MASWVIDGVKFTGEHVDFSDIQQGDEIIHLFVPDDDSGDVKFWSGIVKRFDEVSGVWYGNYRLFAVANDYTGEPFIIKSMTPVAIIQNVIPIVDGTVAIKERHSLYKVIRV